MGHRGRKVVQKDRQAVTTRCVCAGGVCVCVCEYNLKRLAITNDTSRCEINTVTQSAELDKATDRQRDRETGRQTDRRTDSGAGQTDMQAGRQADMEWAAEREIY